MNKKTLVLIMIMLLVIVGCVENENNDNDTTNNQEKEEVNENEEVDTEKIEVIAKDIGDEEYEVEENIVEDDNVTIYLRDFKYDDEYDTYRFYMFIDVNRDNGLRLKGIDYFIDKESFKEDGDFMHIYKEGDKDIENHLFIKNKSDEFKKFEDSIGFTLEMYDRGPEDERDDEELLKNYKIEVMVDK